MPSLTQPQSEALINLLALGMYADGHLSLEEDEALVGKLEELPWDSGTERMLFLGDALTRARQLETEAQTKVYIQKCAHTFDTPELRQSVLESLTDFLGVDGVAEAEKPFFLEVRQALELPA